MKNNKQINKIINKKTKNIKKLTNKINNNYD